MPALHSIPCSAPYQKHREDNKSSNKGLREHGLLQAIARTNRLYEGKDYGLIVDYRGLIEKLDTAMDLYSGAGLENFDEGDLKGVVVDVMSSVAGLRETYTQW